jgi:hypothetical protein
MGSRARRHSFSTAGRVAGALSVEAIAGYEWTQNAAIPQATVATLSGGTGGFKISSVVPALPTGLVASIAGSALLVNGTPTTQVASATAYSFVVTDSANGVPVALRTAVTVAAPLSVAPVVSPLTLTQGTAYSAAPFAVSGGYSPFTHVITGFPATLTPASSGLVTGTPSAAQGSTAAGDVVTDRLGNTANGSLTFSVAAGGAIPVFTQAIPPDGQVGVFYSYTFIATGATSYSLGTGAFPTGLSIDNNGVMSGTPTVAAAYTYTVLATNAFGTKSSATKNVNIAAPVAPTLVSATIASDGFNIALVFSSAVTGTTSGFIAAFSAGIPTATQSTLLRVSGNGTATWACTLEAPHTPPWVVGSGVVATLFYTAPVPGSPIVDSVNGLPLANFGPMSMTNGSTVGGAASMLALVPSNWEGNGTSNSYSGQTITGTDGAIRVQQIDNFQGTGERVYLHRVASVDAFYFGGQRSEFSWYTPMFGSPMQLGVDYWFAFAIRPLAGEWSVEDGITWQDQNGIWQIHGYHDNVNGPTAIIRHDVSASPPLLLHTGHGEGGYAFSADGVGAALPEGVWTKYIIHARLGPTSSYSPVRSVWRDGVQILNLTGAAAIWGAVDDVGFYPKIGFYRSTGTIYGPSGSPRNSRAAYYSELFMGTGADLLASATAALAGYTDVTPLSQIPYNVMGLTLDGLDDAGTYNGVTPRTWNGTVILGPAADPAGSGRTVNIHRVVAAAPPAWGVTHRSEMLAIGQPSYDCPLGVDVWFSWATRRKSDEAQPASTVDDELLVEQSHTDANGATQPPWGLFHSRQRGTTRFIKSYNTKAESTWQWNGGINPDFEASVQLHSEAIQPVDQWWRYVCHVRGGFQAGHNPIIELWRAKPGQTPDRTTHKIVTDTGFNAYNSSNPASYLRMGPYKWDPNTWNGAASLAFYCTPIYYGRGADLWAEAFASLSGL